MTTEPNTSMRRVANAASLVALLVLATQIPGSGWMGLLYLPFAFYLAWTLLEVRDHE